MSTPVSGGCLCGAVRYAAIPKGDEAHFCHCRMCRKAFGNLFGLFFGARNEDVRWEGKPAYFRSSKIARRGFCPECGTPLSMEYDGSDETSLTVGSLDEPARMRPVGHIGIEGRVETFFTEDGLPKSRSEEDEVLAERWRAAGEAPPEGR